MKMNFLKMPVAMAVCGLMLFSCSETEESAEIPGEGQQTETTDSVRTVTYEASLSQDLYDFFDMDLTYTNARGETVTERMTQDVQFTITPTVKLDSVVMKVIGTPKADMPEINDTAMYKKELRYNMNVNSSNKGFSTDKQPFRGDKWGEYVSKERTLVSHVITF